MNLLCPNCQKMITIADQFAGQLMQCPLCSGTFTAPVLPASGAPPAVPLASSVASNPASGAEDGHSQTAAPAVNAPGSQTSGALPAADVVGSEYTHRYIIWISPRVVPWIAPVALVLVFLLLFFPWRSVPADATSELGSLSGWGKLFSGPLLMFYFLLYLIALTLSIGSLLLTLKVVPTQPQIAHLIPWKTCIVAGAVALAFLFLYIGFWGESLSTVWFCSAVCLHLAALIGLGLEYCLERRGPGRSLPRIDVIW